MDWFVAVALARGGRMNGHLSAVQDEVLTGHVAVLPRDVGGWSAQALADVLEETTLAGAPLREWLLAQWGPGRIRQPYALAREILGAPVVRRPETSHPIESWSQAGFCTRALIPVSGRSKLAQLAAESRARGALLVRASAYDGATRPSWAESVLGTAPWSPELAAASVRRLAGSILSRVEQRSTLARALAWKDATTSYAAPTDGDAHTLPPDVFSLHCTR